MAIYKILWFHLYTISLHPQMLPKLFFPPLYIHPPYSLRVVDLEREDPGKNSYQRKFSVGEKNLISEPNQHEVVSFSFEHSSCFSSTDFGLDIIKC